MRIESDHVVIKSAEEAACLFSVASSDPEWQHVLMTPCECPSIEILKEAITPKEGDAVFWWKPYDGITQHELDDPPNYWHSYQNELFEYTLCLDYVPQFVKANALTIDKAVGQLRELLKLCGGE